MNKYPNLILGANAEVEGGETVLTPTEKLFKFEGPKHSQGGIKTTLEGGAKVFSQNMKLPKDVVKSITGMDKKASPAELSKKYDTKKYDDIINDTSTRYDKLAKETASLMKDKHLAMQETIFKAQEQNKEKRTLAKLKKGGMVPKYQDGGLTIPSPFYNQYGYDYMNLSESSGLPYLDANNKLLPQFNAGRYNFQLANAELPFISNGMYNIRDRKQKPEVLDYQHALLGMNGDNYLTDPDSKARRAATVRHYLDSTTEKDRGMTTISIGENDYSISGFADSRNFDNQPPQYRVSRVANPFDVPLAPINQNPINRAGVVSMNKTQPDVYQGKTKEVNNQYDSVDYPGDEKTSEKASLDRETLLYTMQQAANFSDLINLKKSNPYYTYTPSQLAYTRFDPINTKGAERAYNIQKANLEASGLPQSVIQARLADLGAKMQESVNQTNLQNYQGDLQNDNRNTDRYFSVVNEDIRRKDNANYQFEKERQIGDFNFNAQKQEIRKNIFDMWKDRIENQRNISLINMMSNNYEFVNGQVKYKPGTPTDYNKLGAYGSEEGIMKSLQQAIAIKDFESAKALSEILKNLKQ